MDTPTPPRCPICKRKARAQSRPYLIFIEMLMRRLSSAQAASAIEEFELYASRISGSGQLPLPGPSCVVLEE